MPMACRYESAGFPFQLLTFPKMLSLQKAHQFSFAVAGRKVLLGGGWRRENNNREGAKGKVVCKIGGRPFLRRERLGSFLGKIVGLCQANCAAKGRGEQTFVFWRRRPINAGRKVVLFVCVGIGVAVFIFLGEGIQRRFFC